MSNRAISIAMESRLKSIIPAMAIAWENVNFNPVDGEPFEQANMLFAKPENPTFGDDFYRQRGYLQVKLHYPQNKGKKAAFERAELIRQYFNRGLTLEALGVATIVEETPEITNGSIEGNYFAVIVRIRFFANVGTDVGAIPAPPIPAPTAIFEFVQSTADTVWIVNHNLNKFVDVTVTDMAGNEIGADIERTNLNQVRVLFSSPFTGKVLIQ